MAKADVRARFTAEGEAAVLDALKRIETQGARTAKGASRPLLDFGSTLRGTTQLLGAFGIGLGAVALASFIRQSAEAARAQGDLARGLGASLEHFQVLSFLAREAGSSIDSLTQPLQRFAAESAKFEAGAGDPGVARALHALNIEARDFQGLDLAERLELVSTRMSKLATGVNTTAIAAALFERRGAALVEVMDRLGNEGLVNAERRARALATVLDEKVVKEIGLTIQGATTLGAQMAVLAQQLVGGVGPSLAAVFSELSGDDLRRFGSDLHRLGEAVGNIMRAITFAVETAGAGIATVVALLLSVAQTAGAVLAAVARRDLWAAQREIGIGIDQLGKILSTARTSIQNSFDRLQRPGTPGAGAKPDDQVDPNQLFRDRLEQRRAALDGELKLTQARLKAQEDAEKRNLDQGLIGLKEYFTERRRIQTEAFAAEISALQRRRALEATNPDAGKQAVELAKLDNEIALKTLEHRAASIALTYDELEANRQLVRERLAAEGKIREVRGESHAQALAEIRQQGEEFENKFGAGQTLEVARAERRRFEGALIAGADFAEASRRASLAMEDLSLARREIDQQVQAGLLSQVDGERQLLDLEKARLPNLKALALALEAAAAATGNPETIQQAQAFALAVEDLGLAIRHTDDVSARLGATFKDALTQTIATTLQSIDATTRWKDALVNAALSVVDAMRQVVTQMLAIQAVEALFSVFGGVPSGFKSWAAGGGLMGKAEGGLITGPGTGTSDSIPALLSAGEFVVRADVVRQVGVLGQLAQLNRSHGALRTFSPRAGHYAEGGLVTAGEGASVSGHVTVGLEDGLVARAIDSPNGHRLVLKVLNENRRAARSALGT